MHSHSSTPARQKERVGRRGARLAGPAESRPSPRGLGGSLKKFRFSHPPCKPPTRLIVRHAFFLCMHDCVCIFACMPRDDSIQERVGQHTHQVRLRNDVSMPVADAVPSSWSARTWQALRQKLARSRHRATSSASAGGAQKLRANPHRGDLRGGEGEGWLTKTS